MNKLLVVSQLALIALPLFGQDDSGPPTGGPDGLATIVTADSLSGLINGLYGGDGIQLAEFFGHEAHFEGEGFIQFARSLETTLQARSLFPVPSSVGVISYTFNEATGTYERVEGPLGPVLAERGTTSGKGSFNFTLGYSTAEFRQLNGNDTVNFALEHCLRESCLLGNDPDLPIYKDFIDVELRMRLRTEALVASFVYGATDSIDVGLIVPYLQNDLTIEANAEIIKQPGSIEGVHNFDISVETPRQFGQMSKGGIGDVIARAKFRLAENAPLDAAALVDVKFPSGEEENFLGSGDLTVKTTLAASRTGTRFIPHLNLGLEVNTSSTDLSFFDYRLGTEILVTPRLTLTADLIGLIRPELPDEFFVESVDLQLVDRSEIDGSLAAKYRLTDRAVAIVDLLVPLNESGLRPDSSLTFGVQWGL